MRTSLNITAHSGCDGTADDSLESIEAAMRLGADAVEVDVRFNKTGVLILSHDEQPDKEYSGHPRLAEAFDLIQRNASTGINCDIKESETIPAIMDLAAEKNLGPDRLILTGSVTPLFLEENPGILKKASVWLNIEGLLGHLCRAGNEALKPFQHLILNAQDDELLAALLPHSVSLMDELMAACRRWGVTVLNMPYIESAAAQIPRMKELGFAASVWTVNTAEPLAWLFHLGALNITTRNTRLAVETRRGMG